MTNEHIHELLAFRANGTLEGEDLAMVEAALDADADLRAEIREDDLTHLEGCNYLVRDQGDHFSGSVEPGATTRR